MYVITRNAFPNGNVDFLIGWCPKWRTEASCNWQRAMTFPTIEAAIAAKAKAEKLVRKWVCGAAIEYGIEWVGYRTGSIGCTRIKQALELTPAERAAINAKED
jgi:hypothetical protein